LSEQIRFKDHFDQMMAERLAAEVTAVFPTFNTQSFIKKIVPLLPALELKQRVALFSQMLHEELPAAYPHAVEILLGILKHELHEEEGMFNDGWMLMPIAHFVEMYGLHHFDESVHAMYEITKRHTAEFTIRPFLQAYPDRLLPILHKWTQDPSPHVRRLVSEGTRPRLPWAGYLNQFITDPMPTLALLEKLKDDPSEYVRRSVANHLNDMTKDHPDLVIETCRRWQKEASNGTEWIIRHALRSLIKEGNPGALTLLGFAPPQLSLSAFTIEPATIQMCDTFSFSFILESETAVPQNLIIDYVIYFVKANGSQNGKVFKLKKVVLQPGESLTVTRNHKIKPITTRRYYPGTHRVTLQINGHSVGEVQFDLI
jgi:3-methyladenine DNA glycosylase AlkC